MVRLSIIVPIYNAGARLVKLLDSLLNQTIQDMNILCILDCPTDGSDRVCFQYAAKDKRIIPIVNSKNLGIGASRNIGIEEAIKRGAVYIGFADHDDYLEKNAYELMLNCANKNRGGRCGIRKFCDRAC